MVGETQEPFDLAQGKLFAPRRTTERFMASAEGGTVCESRRAGAFRPIMQNKPNLPAEAKWTPPPFPKETYEGDVQNSQICGRFDAARRYQGGVSRRNESLCGPNRHPGGPGSEDDPKIRGWLEFVGEEYGPYVPLQPKR